MLFNVFLIFITISISDSDANWKLVKKMRFAVLSMKLTYTIFPTMEIDIIKQEKLRN